MEKKLKQIMSNYRLFKKYCKEHYSYTLRITYMKTQYLGNSSAEYNLRYYDDAELNKETDKMYKNLTKLIKKDKTVYLYKETIIMEELKEDEE